MGAPDMPGALQVRPRPHLLILIPSCTPLSSPQGRNVVLESKYGSPKIVNDGVTVAKEVELEDPVENIGAKLVRQAASRTNDLAGDGTTTATILSAAMIAEGMKIVMAGVNPVQVIRGMEKTGEDPRAFLPCLLACLLLDSRAGGGPAGESLACLLTQSKPGSLLLARRTAAGPRAG